MTQRHNTDFKARLSRRIGMEDIYEILYLTQSNDQLKKRLYDLLFDSDNQVAYQAAWVFTHFPLSENQWLYNKQDALIDELLNCTHAGKRRLLLALLYRQPLNNPPRVDFLDYCLEQMVSPKELPGVTTLCMKLAYELCRFIPELLEEFRLILETLDSDLLPVSMRTVRKNIWKAMQKGNSLQDRLC